MADIYVDVPRRREHGKADACGLISSPFNISIA